MNKLFLSSFIVRSICRRRKKQQHRLPLIDAAPRNTRSPIPLAQQVQRTKLLKKCRYYLFMFLFPFLTFLWSSLAAVCSWHSNRISEFYVCRVNAVHCITFRMESVSPLPHSCSSSFCRASCPDTDSSCVVLDGCSHRRPHRARCQIRTRTCGVNACGVKRLRVKVHRT